MKIEIVLLNCGESVAKEDWVFGWLGGWVKRKKQAPFALIKTTFKVQLGGALLGYGRASGVA